VRFSEFRLHVATEYPQIADETVSMLWPLNSAYRCEAGFSAVTAVKPKYTACLMFYRMISGHQNN
jgi:hypothetical protein